VDGLLLKAHAGGGPGGFGGSLAEGGAGVGLSTTSLPADDRALASILGKGFKNAGSFCPKAAICLGSLSPGGKDKSSLVANISDFSSARARLSASATSSAANASL